MAMDGFRHIQIATSGAQILLFVLAAQFESRLGWLICLPLIALLSLVAWLAVLKKYRAISDTPTSKIASAAQGYVELIGRGDYFVASSPLISRLTHKPCLWYRFSVEHKDHDGDWHTVESGSSDDSFQLRDDTGACNIDPEGAEIITQHKETWTSGFHRYTEWMLLKNDAIYVLGGFRTEGGSTAEFNPHEEENQLLAAWKKDMPTLHQRFDLDGDGALNETEWMLARRAAKREVRQKAQEVRSQADVNVLGKPRDGQLFVISNLTPEKLARRYLYWIWGNLALFFIGLVGFGWVLQHSF